MVEEALLTGSQASQTDFQSTRGNKYLYGDLNLDIIFEVRSGHPFPCICLMFTEAAWQCYCRRSRLSILMLMK